MYLFKTADTEYSAEFAGKVMDHEWDERESKSIRLQMSYTDALTLFQDGLVWSIVERETDLDSGDENVQEWDNSDYCIAGSITDHRDGTVTVKMGKKTANDILAELEEAYDGN